MAAPDVKIDDPEPFGWLERLEPFVKVQVEGGKKYKKYRMKLVLRKVPKVPVCDVHIEFPKKPKIWDDLPESDPTKPAADQVKLTGWGTRWESSYDPATGVLKIESSDCDKSRLLADAYLLSFLVDDAQPPVQLGKVKVSLTDAAHKVIANTKAGNEKELD